MRTNKLESITLAGKKKKKKEKVLENEEGKPCCSAGMSAGREKAVTAPRVAPPHLKAPGNPSTGSCTQSRAAQLPGEPTVSVCSSEFSKERDLAWPRSSVLAQRHSFQQALRYFYPTVLNFVFIALD